MKWWKALIVCACIGLNWSVVLAEETPARSSRDIIKESLYQRTIDKLDMEKLTDAQCDAVFEAMCEAYADGVLANPPQALPSRSMNVSATLYFKVWKAPTWATINSARVHIRGMQGGILLVRPLWNSGEYTVNIEDLNSISF